ncbi:MAG: hypothetical protein PHQ34_01355 [Methanothrix sp.]|nr:hypothetical protein [Methanothrix sp.]
MELVYPIYLDEPMLMAFLGSLTGGIAEETTVESKTQGSKERATDAQIRAKVSEWISSLIGAEGEAGVSRKATESSESQYKSTVRFPQATLFFQLRELLFEQDLIEVLDSSESLESISLGDIVEFQGLAVANPGYQIRNFFNQLLPAIEPILSFTKPQLDLNMNLLKGAKPGKPILMGGKELNFQNQNEINSVRDSINAQKQQIENLSSIFASINTIFSRLYPADDLDNILFKSGGFDAILRIYPAFARDKRIQDLFDGNWRCIGKVINIIGPSEKYDLLKDAPISYFAKDQFSAIEDIFKNDNIKMNVTDSSVSGPAIIVTPLAIFT